MRRHACPSCSLRPRRGSRATIGLLVAALLASACASGSDPSAGAEGGQASASGAATVVSRLAPEYAVEHAVAASVGPDGATLRTTDDHGTTYVLDIPPDALAATTVVQLTPVSTAGGLPDGVTWHFGVEFSPSGLQLAQPALLTIERPDLADVEFIAYRGPHRDVHLTEGFVEPGRARLQVGGFSGRGGIGCGGPCVDAGIQPPAPVDAAGAFEAASEAMRKAVIDRQHSQLTGEAETEGLWDEAARALADAIARLSEECRQTTDVDESFRSARRMISLGQRAHVMGIDEGLDAEELLDSCLRFEFELDARFEDGDGSVWLAVEHLRARFPLRRDGSVHVGQAPFEIVEAQVARPGLGCTVGLQPDVAGGGEVEPVRVVAMRFVFLETGDDVEVHDAEVLLDPGWVQMHQAEPCVVEHVTIIDHTHHAYATGWYDLHEDEFVQVGMVDAFWRITGWDIRHGGEVVAEKRYERSDVVHTVPIREDTTLRILMAPRGG